MSKVSKMCVSKSSSGLLNPQKCQRIHQEQEVYHHLYKDKLEKLVKVAIIEHLPELQNIPTNGDDEDNSEDNGDDSSKNTKAGSLKKIRVLHMKIQHEVRAAA